MTVGELKKVLYGYSDDLEIVIRDGELIYRDIGGVIVEKNTVGDDVLCL